MKKSYLLISLILVMILAVSAVSAADNDVTSDLAESQVSDEVVSTPAEDPVVTATDDPVSVEATPDSEVLKDPGDKNFTQLQNDVNSAEDSGMPLTLTSNYVRADGESDVVITKNVNIFGNDEYKIDANNLGGIFKISSGCSVLLNNVILANGNAQYGGAIYNEGTVTLMSSQITGSSASQGGVIYNTGVATITGSTLDENTATEGGAVYSTNYVAINGNSILKDNTASNGGAIYSKGTADIEDAEFNHNTATYRGGAIWSDGIANIEDSSFDSNNITYRARNVDNGGAAIFNNGELNVDHSRFTNDLVGYVVRTGDHNSPQLIDGVVLSSGVAVITNSYFENNSGTYGGAITAVPIASLGSTFTSLTVENCEFVNNLAFNGAAINVNADGSGHATYSIKNCTFTGNTATGIGSTGSSSDGGAIFLARDTEGTITDSKFYDNSAAMGGAIAISASKNSLKATIDNCEFVNNVATGADGIAAVGGAIRIGGRAASDKMVVSVENSKFRDNVATDGGSAIHNYGTLALSGNTVAGTEAGIVNKATITSPVIAVINSDKASYRMEEVTLTATLTDDMGNAINDTTFKFIFNTPEGLADIPAVLGDDGKYTAKFTPTKTGEYNVTADYDGVTNATFTVYRTLTDLKDLVDNANGNPVVLDGDYTYNADFDSDIKTSGGIYISNEVTIDGKGFTICGNDSTRLFKVTGGTLTLTNVTLCHGYANVGGVVFVNSGELNVDYVNFTDNRADNGVICSRNADVNINHAKFVNNDVINRVDTTPVISAEGGRSLIINNSVFENNVKIKGNRTKGDNMYGIIATYLINLKVYNSNFTNNSGVQGGVLTIAAGSTIIDNCRFINNTAYEGGAIQIYYGANVDINNSYFEDNVAAEYGSPGYTSSGGAIAITNNGNAVTNIKGSTFKHNSVIVGERPHGGAVSIQNSITNIESCVFEDNEAGIGGAVFINEGNKPVSVTKSEFIDNTATIGNAIANQGKLILSKNTISTDQADIVSIGEIDSQINVTTYDATVGYTDKVNLTATVTDDNGNLINSNNFYFVVNNTNYGPAVYNAATQKYEFEQEFSLVQGVYEITMKYDKELTYVERGNLTVTPLKGTYTDLQYQINNAKDGVLELTYDFAYNATYDGDKFPNGVMITKDLTINGNDHSIDGNNTVRIFASFATVSLNDIVFKNGKTTKGGAIYTTGNLDIDNCTFIDNTATVAGNDIYVDVAPYQVYLVYDEASYNAAYNGTDSPLYKYYKLNPTEDIDNNDPRGHSWTAAISAPVGNTVPAGKSRFPWIVLNMLDDEGFTGYISVMFNGTKVFGPWGELTNKKYAIISVPGSDDCGMVEYALDKDTGHADKELETELFEAFFANNEGVISATTNPNKLVSVKDSTFDANTNGYSIYNKGNLKLDNNIIPSGIFNEGNLTSEFTAVVLDNKTVNTTTGSYILNATLVDDSNNLIYDPNLRFTVNGVEIAGQPDYNNGLYTLDYNQFTTDYPTYIIGVNTTNTDNLVVKTGTVKNLLVGTFTDLAGRIVATTAGETLVLPYDFTYTPEIDAANYANGIVIDKNIIINGNGSVISADGASMNIFTIPNGYTVTLANATVTGVNMAADKKWGAVVNKGNLTIDNCTFKDNAINKVSSGNGGAAVFNTGTSLVISDSRFINNTAPWSGSTGAVSSWVNSYLLIENSYFEGNLARFGAAIEIEELDQKEVAVRNCTFFNNSGYSGVSINANANVKYLNVTNCTFDSNNFHGPQGAPTTGGMGAGITAGTARKVPVTLEVSDSIFKNNYGDDQDGSVCAAIRLADCASGIITNCTFENNYGTPNVAISAGTIHNDTATVTVKDSTFIGNDATNGMTVRISPGIDASVENCNFSADTNDIAIYNSGTLSLSKNTIDSVIYNKGTITSETNITVLNNKTVNAVYGEPVSLNATYTDDNGNPIYDPNFKFTVAGVADPIDAVYADGVYTATYKADKVEEKVVSAELPYDVDTYNGLLDIGPATVILTIDANETIMRKQNETITIKLSDEFGNLLNLSLPVVVQNSAEEDVFSQTITTQNGTYTFNLTGLGVDTYTITAVFSNDNYVPNPKIATKPFEVTPLEINGTYTDLQKQIDETLENGVLILPYDFAYYDFVDEDFFPYGVIINKNITIDGNGSTISGSKVYRIFNITAGNVVFNNITFVDGIADNGGAIYANSTEDITVTILNSTFANNTATIGGGAVAFMSDDDSKVTYYIIDSLFENNTARGTYSEDESVAGGAVYSEGITDWCYIGFTTFKNNKAIEGNMPNGGAVKVQFGGQLVVLNSTFEDNFAGQDGGAIKVQSNTNMNCTVIVLNSKFENNKAGMVGAAVSAIETSGNSLVVIINSTLENNVADITAHAVYVSPRSNVAVINTTLTGNGGDTDYGIYNLGKLALINNTVSNIIYTNSAYGEGVITTDTYARILENQTIDITSDRYTLVTTLTDDNGNKIYDRNLEFTINGVPIDAVLDYDKESGLYTYVFEIGSERIYVVNVTSDNEKKLNTEIGILRNIKGTYTDLKNLIDEAEGTLVLPYNFTYTEAIDGANFPSGVVINKPITIDGKGFTISGNNSYRIFKVNNATTLNNITFVNGSAVEFGGAIYAVADLTVANSTFDNNAVAQNDANGGAIMVEAAGTSDVTFNVYNVNFTNNFVDNGGAAIGVAAVNGNKLTYNIYDSLFENNIAEATGGLNAAGGAIFSYGTTIGLINNTTFKGNKAETGDVSNGGAIKIQFGGTLTVANSTFEDNKAGLFGGAIALQANTGMNNVLTVDNCTFSGNDAAYGAAIGANQGAGESSVTIKESEFAEDNAVYIGQFTTASISGSEFTTAEDYAIKNTGTLELAGNTVKSIYNKGTITSETTARILDNGTYDISSSTYELNATLVDDQGNNIFDPTLQFTINGEPIDAVLAYDPATGLYTYNFEISDKLFYLVSVASDKETNLVTETGILRNIKGTYTDLQNLIDAADGELDLEYDFTYNAEIDGENFLEGVVIADPIKIEGNGFTISGNNSYRIFRITAETTINNVTFTNGSAVEFGGAIYTTANLTVSNSTFVNNSVALNDANGGAIAAIADGSEITLNVNNVLFENNCVDNAGGAIAVATMDSKVNYNIYDSEFVDNYAYEAIAASGGAIFSYGNTEGLINNTVFRRNYIDCEDLSNGGAIKLQFGGKLTVANSTFEDNEAEYTGSAISVQADDGKNNVLVVDNCTFTGNSASYGDTITSKQYAGESVVIIKGSTFDSGIFLDELTKASISNSTIENEGYHGIYNLGLLILDKNVVDIIYNNGTILSSVNATLLGNETVPAELYDEVYPFATLTDDNGNPIYDPNFRITVNDVVIEDVEYDYDENVYVSNYTIEKPGDYVVSTLYAADIYTGIYQVPKANITRFEVIPGGQDNRIPYGENVTVYVVLEGVDGEGLNETFNVIVNNAEYPVTVTNGSGSFNVSGLAPGQYAALGIFPGNDCYNKAYATGIFTVLEPEAKLTIEIEDITVGDILIVKVNLTDFEGNPIFGTVEVGIDNHTYSIVVYGNGSFAISDVPAGNYTAVAASIADASHASVNNTTDFEVKKISKYDFIATAGTGYEYGETVEVDVFLPENAAGNVTITINDTSYSATVENGTATIEIPGLAIGDYEDVEVLYSGDDNYNPGTTNVTIYVLPADPEFAAYANHTLISYGENATIIIDINENATGNISVYSHDYETEEQKFLFNVTVEKAREGISIGGLNIGENFFDLVYSGDAIFAEDEASAWVTVEKAVINWSIEPDYDVIIDVNDTVNVKLVNVTEGAEGNITITIDGFEYGTYTLEEALAGINITEFDTPGTYTVEVAFIENPNYEYTPSSLSFDVTVDTIDADMNVTVPEDAKVGDTVNITVELPEDASGELAVIVDGVEVANVDVEGGKVIVPVEDLASGEHNVVVIYSGDDKYDKATEETILNVSKVDPTIEIAIDDDDAVVGGSVHVTVTLPDDATNYVLVDVNGMQYFGELEEGVYSFDIDDLQAIEYEIDVTYVGDDKYNKGTSSYNFTVRKATSDIEANLPGEAYVGDFVVVEVTVDPAAATGNYSVFIDGVDVSEQFGDLNITNGKGIFVITALTNGTHTIGVKYNGDNNYEASDMREYTIVINKVDVSSDINIEGSEITYGENATVTFELPDDATGTVTVTINGVDYTADVDENGIAVVEIPGLDADIYENVAAKYSGDDKYEAYEGNATIEVEPLFVDWFLDNDDIYIDVNETVFLNIYDVTEGGDGLINVTVNGEEFGVFSLDLALAGIEIDVFNAPGEYTVVFAFVDNPNFEYASPVDVLVIVRTIDADMNVTVPEDAKVGDTVNITVELPEDAAGEVVVFIDGVEVASVDVEGGKVIVPVEDLAAGEHNVVVIYSGDDKYDTATEETVLNVNKVLPTIEIEVDGDGVVGGSAHVTVTLPDDATDYVLVDVNGMQYFGELEEGVYSFDIDDLEALTYDIEVTYVGDDKYNKATKFAKFTVGKSNATIEANLPGEAYVGDFVVVEVTVDPAAATGNYSVFIDGVDVSEQFGNLNITNGKGIFVITALTNGTHTIGVKYNGDNNYKASDMREYTIVINKVDVSGDIHIEGSEITYGENATVTFELPDDATGTVTVTINGVDYTADVDGGIAVVEIPGLDADIYENVAAKYSGDDKYEAYEGNATIEVEPLFVDWFLDNDDIYIDVNETVTLNIYDVTEGGEGSINVTVNGEEFGVYSLGQALAGIEIDVFNAPGEYTVVFAFVDNPNFEYASPVDVLVIVRTIDADMNVTLPSDAEAGSPSEITVELPQDATGNVTVIVDGKEVATAPVEDGKATVEVPGLTAGNHTVDVVYSGDDTYSPAIVSDNLTVSKADATVVGEADDITVGEDATIIITVPSDAKGVVLVDIDGQSLYGNIVDGKATVTVSGLTAGEKTATITLTSDDKYAETSNTTTFTVNKVKEYDMSVNSTTPREGQNATVTVELPSDANGNVTVTDSNGNSVTVPVENGKATVEVPGLTEGENNVTVTYSGDDKYDSKSENTTVNVKPALINTVLSAEKLEMYVGDGSKFQAKLLDEDGNPVVNRGIKVTICGKTYTIKTNSSGIAVLPINLKAGSYPTTLVFNGDSQYNASNVVSTSVEVYTKVRITENKDLVKTYGGSEKFTVRALDKYGKPVGAYAKVKMTIAGKTYTVNTDSNGYASLPINLKAGTYQITTEYGGTTVFNTVTVKSK